MDVPSYLEDLIHDMQQKETVYMQWLKLLEQFRILKYY